MRKSVVFSLILMAAATLALSVVLGLYLQGSGPMPQVTGTVYTSTQKGMESDVTVTVTVKDGKITAVTADVSGETKELGQVAGPQVCEAVLAAGTSEGVDAVSGCTVTSDAILAGVQDCMVQAGIWDSANSAASASAAAQ